MDAHVHYNDIAIVWSRHNEKIVNKTNLMNSRSLYDAVIDLVDSAKYLVWHPEPLRTKAGYHTVLNFKEKGVVFTAKKEELEILEKG